jgi:gliding motility-associated-like protein
LDESQDDLLNQSYRYIVKANSAETGLPQAVSNPVIVTKRSNIFYPTAFTPNGDNLNDLFNVFGQYIVTFEMNIFNRWGELVFNSTALDLGWDGTFRSNPMPEGTYTFVAEITDRAGRSYKKSGSVLLLRKR